MKTHFFLARHGETQWNKLKKLQGQLDSSLTNAGIAQAKQLADSLLTHSLDLIVSSPLARAQVTAEIVAQALTLPVEVNTNLSERHFGDWQGALFSELQDALHFNEIFYQVTDHSPPAGESGSSAVCRMQAALITLAQQKPHDNILIITHGDILRCFLAQLQDTEFSDAFELYKNCCVIPVCFEHETQMFTLPCALAESV